MVAAYDGIRRAGDRGARHRYGDDAIMPASGPARFLRHESARRARPRRRRRSRGSDRQEPRRRPPPLLGHRHSGHIRPAAAWPPGRAEAAVRAGQHAVRETAEPAWLRQPARCAEDSCIGLIAGRVLQALDTWCWRREGRGARLRSRLIPSGFPPKGCRVSPRETPVCVLKPGYLAATAVTVRTAGDASPGRVPRTSTASMKVALTIVAGIVRPKGQRPDRA
jgi:hypothetical protein